MTSQQINQLRLGDVLLRERKAPAARYGARASVAEKAGTTYSPRVKLRWPDGAEEWMDSRRLGKFWLAPEGDRT